MSSDTYQIRPATSSDINVLVDLGIKTFRETFARDNTEEDMQLYLASAFDQKQVAADLGNDGIYYLIAESGREVIGYAKLVVDIPERGGIGINPIELERIYVRETWLGKGVGAGLMTACLAEGRRQGHDVIWLGVWDRNERAIRFYEKWGFEIFGSHSFQLGSDRQTDFLLQRPLSD